MTQQNGVALYIKNLEAMRDVLKQEQAKYHRSDPAWTLLQNQIEQIDAILTCQRAQQISEPPGLSPEDKQKLQGLLKEANQAVENYGQAIKTVLVLPDLILKVSATASDLRHFLTQKTSPA